MICTSAMTSLRSGHQGTLRPAADPKLLAHGLLAAFHGGVLILRAVQSSALVEAAFDAMIATWRCSGPGSRVTAIADDASSAADPV
jgi:hypothetical protein